MRTRLSAPVRTGPEAHPASGTMSAGSFVGVKRPGRAVEHLPPFFAEIKERVELYIYSACEISWPVPERSLSFIHLLTLVITKFLSGRLFFSCKGSVNRDVGYLYVTDIVP
jgi:hypothetical protein